MKRTMKFLHEVGTVGLMGAIGTQIVLATTAAELGPHEFATLRFGMLNVSRWIMLPSLVIVLTSGIMAWALHRAYHDKPWAWMKAALTVAVLEGTLVAIQGPARRAAELSAKLAGGDDSVAAALNDALRHERGGLWIIMGLCVINIALAVWRPRFRWMTPK